MKQLATLRRLTDRDLISFLSFLEEHGVRPNSDWVSLSTLGRWLNEAEQSQGDENIMPIAQNRAEYRKLGDRQGWQHNFLRVKLFDFLMSRYDVMIVFQQWHNDVSFYFKAPYYLGKREQSWAACESALQRTRQWVHEDQRANKRRRW